MPVFGPKILIAIGILAILVGLIWMYGGKYFGWVGRLPGDIRVEREGFRFYFPFTTMVFCSLIYNILIRVYKWIAGS